MPDALADDLFTARLQVGRFLPLPLQVPIVLVRQLIGSLVFQSVDTYVAPAWVIVTRKDDGSRVGRIPAGREYGVGDELLRLVQDSMRRLDPDAFFSRYHLGPGG